MDTIRDRLQNKRYKHCVEGYDAVSRDPQTYPECIELYTDISNLSDEEKSKIFDDFMDRRYDIQVKKLKKLQEKQLQDFEKGHKKWEKCTNPQTYIDLQNVRWVPANNLIIIKEGDHNYCFTLRELETLCDQHDEYGGWIHPRNPVTRTPIPMEIIERIMETNQEPLKTIEQVVDETTSSVAIPLSEVEQEQKIREIEASYMPPGMAYSDPYITVEQYINTDPRLMAYLPEELKINDTIPLRDRLTRIQGFLRDMLEYENPTPEEREEIDELRTTQGNLIRQIAEISKDNAGPIIDYLYGIKNQYWNIPNIPPYSKAYLLMKIASLKKILTPLPGGTSEDIPNVRGYRERLRDYIFYLTGRYICGSENVNNIENMAEIPLSLFRLPTSRAMNEAIARAELEESQEMASELEIRTEGLPPESEIGGIDIDEFIETEEPQEMAPELEVQVSYLGHYRGDYFENEILPQNEVGEQIESVRREVLNEIWTVPSVLFAKFPHFQRITSGSASNFLLPHGRDFWIQTSEDPGYFMEVIFWTMNIVQANPRGDLIGNTIDGKTKTDMLVDIRDVPSDVILWEAALQRMRLSINQITADFVRNNIDRLNTIWNEQYNLKVREVTEDDPFTANEFQIRFQSKRAHDMAVKCMDLLIGTSGERTPEESAIIFAIGQEFTAVNIFLTFHDDSLYIPEEEPEESEDEE